MSWGPGVDWQSHKRLHIKAGVHSAALTGYQYPVKCIIGEGTNGSYTSDSGNEGSVFYLLPGQCRSNFSDFRFYCGDIAYDFHRFAKTDNVSAEWNVEVASDLTSDGVLDIYFGNFGDGGAVDASSAADTYVTAPIPNVVAAWPLDEADQEVDPIEINRVSSDFWSTFYEGEASNRSSISLADGVEVTLTEGTKTYSRLYHVYDSNQNWSAKNKVRVKFTGTASGKNFRIMFSDRSDDTGYSGLNYFEYLVTDSATSERWLDTPLSTFTATGTIDWTMIRKVVVNFDDFSSFTGTLTLSDFIVDVGVPAVDYSGNGNDGAATGTTINADVINIDRNSRYLNGVGDYFVVAADASLDNLAEVTYTASIKPVIGAAQIICEKKASVRTFGIDAGGHLTAVSTTGGESVSVETLTNNTVARVGFRYSDSGDQKIDLFINGVECTYSTEAANTALDDDSAGDFTVGARVPLASPFKGYMANLFVYDVALSDAELLAEASNLPDPSLIAGSVCLREWADTTNPTHGSWEPEHKYYPKGIYSLSRPRQQLKLKKLKPDQIAAIREYFINRVESEVV